MTKLEFPRLVAIETTNRCNASCSFCPNSALMRDRATMDDALFEKIIRDCATFPLQAVEPFLQGEPFVDPRIFERLELISRLLPQSCLRLYSNGAALTPRKADRLREFDVDHLYISLNTSDPVAYRKITGLSYERTLENLRYLTDSTVGKRVARKITVRMTVTDETTDRDKARFLLLCHRLKVRPLLVGLFNYKGSKYGTLPVPMYPCEHITRLDILVDGQTTLCCMDHDGEYGWGSVVDRSVLEVFNSAEAQRVRSMHRSGQRGRCVPCDTCNLFWADFSHVPLGRRFRFWTQLLAYHGRHRPLF